MMVTEIFKIDASWAEKLTKARVKFLLTPTVIELTKYFGFRTFVTWVYSRRNKRAADSLKVSVIFY